MALKDSRKTVFLSEARLASLPDVLTVSQLARFLGISRNHAYSLVRRGEIEYVKLGALIRIPVAGLRRKLEEAGKEAETDGSKEQC